MFRFVNCRTYKAPMVSNVFELFILYSLDEETSAKKYQNMSSRQKFVAREFCCDIKFAVKVMAQYSSKQTFSLFRWVKRIFGYFQLTQNFAIQSNLNGKQSHVLNFYSKTDIKGSHRSRMSWSQCMVSAFGLIFVWGSCKKSWHTDASSNEEYIAAWDACANTKWLWPMLAELSFIKSSLSLQYCICVVPYNWAQKTNTMHIENQKGLKLHFEKESATDGLSTAGFIFINSGDTTADGLVILLIRTKYKIFCDKVGVKLWKAQYRWIPGKALGHVMI